MSDFTAKGLVNYILDIYNNKKTLYMWGGIMRPISYSYISQLAKMYPSQYPAARQKTLKTASSMDYFGVDCVGLIKSYYWSGVGSPKYSGATDYNAGMMYNAAKVKGKLADLPERSGLILYSKTNPHVGVYIGSGLVIESTLGSRGDGVSKSKLQAFGWEYWFECPCIDYSGSVPGTVTAEVEAPTVYSIGDKVKITGKYADSSISPLALHSSAIGMERYITKICSGSNFPFQLGVYPGDTSSKNTTGFAAVTSIIKE